MRVRNAFLAAVTAIALTATLPALAQTRSYKADIPFQFVAGDRSMPAGEYRIVTIPWTNRIEMYAPDGVTTVCFTAWRGGGTTHPGTLTFARHNTRTFLRSIEVDGRNVRLPKSRAEREMAKVNASTELALFSAPVK